MVVILESHETEWLKYAIRRLYRSRENFRHAVYRAGLGLKCEFNKRTATQRMLQLQQPASNGNSLQFSFCAPAIF